MTITFNGAASLVTGSCYLLNVDGLNVLIDFGMFQGIDENIYNSHPLNFDPNQIDIVLLTHAHLDHCGLLPVLSKYGYKGPIYSTIQTKQIAETILLDSAKIQEINSEKIENYIPLYNTNDALTTLSLFQEVDFLNTITFKDLSFKFIPVGHVLGAASIYIESKEGNFIFSGDIGRKDQSIVKPLNELNYKELDPNYIIMESLYAGVQHIDRDSSTKQLLSIINETISNNGTVYVPVFALHRTQEMLNIFKHLFRSNELPGDIKVYLDSPMAAKITNIYTNNPSLYSSDFINLNSQNDQFDHNPFTFDNLSLVKKAKKSLSISNQQRSIILAGSGMAEGGRIVRHLYSNLENKNNSFIFVGFQAEGTLGKALCSGNKKVIINGKEIEVKASIYQLFGYSAHGDNEDLLYWFNSFNHSLLKKVFLVHAEDERLNNLMEQLSNTTYDTIIPKMYDSFTL